MKPTITIGRTVIYTLSTENADEINRMPNTNGDHYGPTVAPGDELPAVVTRTHTDSKVNLKVFLDGTDMLWVPLIEEGAEPGQWKWPAMRSDNTEPVESK